MKYLVLCGTALVSLFLAELASSETTPNSPPTLSVVYELKGLLQLPCNMSESKAGQEVKWTKDGKPLKDYNLGSRLKTDLTLLTIDKAILEDAGNYTCEVTLNNVLIKQCEFAAESKPIIRIPSNINVVEGEKLYIHCNVISKPAPVLAWEIGNMTYNTSEDRVKLMEDTESGIPNSILVIEDIQLNDRNEYVCLAKAPSQDHYSARGKTLVRVKDKLAALWPFLGICAEVFVLCAIILIYEKKRNKTELEESDTDQSPDQKNTPDHGKDSDVRQRK